MLTRYYWIDEGMEIDESGCSVDHFCHAEEVAALEARLAEIEAWRCETCALYHPVNADYGLCVRNQAVMVFPDHGCRAWVAKEERDG